MFRLFARFYLVIALPLLFLFIPAINPVRALAQHWGADFYSREFSGVFYLVGQRLEELPRDQWRDTVKDLDSHFGVRLALVSLEDEELGFFGRRRLARGEPVLRLGGNARLYERIGDSPFALSLGLAPDNEDVNQLLLNGPVYLLDQMLAKQPRSRWREIVTPDNLHSETPVALLPVETLPEKVRNNPRLAQRKLIEDKLAPNLTNLYVASPDPQWAYRFGPVDERLFQARVDSLARAAPAALLALGILLLAWPLWRDIRELRRTATAFAEGDLDRRARLGRRAALAPLGEAFNRMGDSLRRLLKGQKALTNAVSHEIKTPLARIRFTTELLRDAADDEERERLLRGIDEEVGEIETLVADLLRHARYDRSVSSEALRPRDLRPLLNKALARCREHYPALRWEETLAPGAETVFEFERRGMETALANLLRNAALHAASVVRVTLDGSAEQVILSVEDDGPGVPAEDRQRIFEPFLRLDEARQRDTGGNGLGLAIVRQVARWHGGEVVCEASPLGGARFVVTLPQRHRKENQA